MLSIFVKILFYFMFYFRPNINFNVRVFSVSTVEFWKAQYYIYLFIHLFIYLFIYLLFMFSMFYFFMQISIGKADHN